MLQTKEAFIKLGQWLGSEDTELTSLIVEAARANPWFTVDNINLALQAIRTHFLAPDKLEAWLRLYDIKEDLKGAQKIALILAGNIPLVGFHDTLCVLLAGQQALVKLSDRDNILLPGLFSKISQWYPGHNLPISFVDRIQDFQAVIATGSNQSAKHFEKYFSNIPHIIRKNRNSIAVLTGDESPGELRQLGFDIFSFFGLGCRNVSKLYVPADYDFIPILNALNEFKEVMDHSKYRNNFDYHLATAIINQEPYMSNECMLLFENEAIASRVAVVHFEYYVTTEKLNADLKLRKDEIQCIVSNVKFNDFVTVEFGQAQHPQLSDYADGIDVMEFLHSITS